jgi:hypothetical protein
MVALNQTWKTAFKRPHSAPSSRQTPHHHEPLCSNRTWQPLRARYYDPHTAEFTSPDPLEYVDGMSLFRGYFVILSVDVLGLSTAECHVIAFSSGAGNPRTECIDWGHPVGGKIVKTTCRRWRCFFRCYCPNRDNCPDRPCHDPDCDKDHGIEVHLDSTLNDRGWIAKRLGAGAPRCSLMTGEASKQVSCTKAGPKLKKPRTKKPKFKPNLKGSTLQ